jgi:hypothetical protein
MIVVTLTTILVITGLVAIHPPASVPALVRSWRRRVWPATPLR